jgi:CheY-like chemotaxis protein
MPDTVLVVEDDHQVRTLVTTILHKLGHETLEATNAWQALAALQNPVDLVILDVRMPYDISGGDLITTLQDLGRDVPVIVFSGWTEDLDDDLPGFVKAVLSKPVRVEQFVETVNQTLGTASTP